MPRVSTSMRAMPREGAGGDGAASDGTDTRRPPIPRSMAEAHSPEVAASLSDMQKEPKAATLSSPIEDMIIGRAGDGVNDETLIRTGTGVGARDNDCPRPSGTNEMTTTPSALVCSVTVAVGPRRAPAVNAAERGQGRAAAPCSRARVLRLIRAAIRRSPKTASNVADFGSDWRRRFAGGGRWYAVCMEAR